MRRKTLATVCLLLMEPVFAQENFFPPGSVIEPDAEKPAVISQRPVPSITLGPDGDFDVPHSMGLMLYAHTVSQILDEPELRALWVQDFGLTNEIEYRLRLVLGDFLASYDVLEEERVNQACAVYYDATNIADGSAEALAYGVLYGPLVTTDSEALYEFAMNRLEGEVSPEIAQFILKGVVHKVEQASIKMLNYEINNQRHGVSAETFFAGECN